MIGLLYGGSTVYFNFFLILIIYYQLGDLGLNYYFVLISDLRTLVWSCYDDNEGCNNSPDGPDFGD